MKKVELHKVMPPNMETREVNSQYLKGSSRPFCNFMDNTGGPGRPLTGDVEDRILPKVLGINSNHPEKETKILEYWSDLRVQADDGVIRLNVPESAEEAEQNQRYVKDYCVYQLALIHPLVANNEEEARNAEHYFVISDLEKVRKDKLQDYRKKNKAHELRIKHSDEPGVLNQALRVLSRNMIDELKEEDKEMELDRIVNERPEAFITIMEDEKLEKKAFAKELVDMQIVESNYYGDGTHAYTYLDKHLGDTLDKLTNFLANSTQNSEVINKMQSEYESKKAAKEEG